MVDRPKIRHHDEVRKYEGKVESLDQLRAAVKAKFPDVNTDIATLGYVDHVGGPAITISSPADFQSALTDHGLMAAQHANTSTPTPFMFVVNDKDNSISSTGQREEAGAASSLEGRQLGGLVRGLTREIAALKDTVSDFKSFLELYGTETATSARRFVEDQVTALVAKLGETNMQIVTDKDRASVATSDATTTATDRITTADALKSNLGDLPVGLPVHASWQFSNSSKKEWAAGAYIKMEAGGTLLSPEGDTQPIACCKDIPIKPGGLVSIQVRVVPDRVGPISSAWRIFGKDGNPLSRAFTIEGAGVDQNNGSSMAPPPPPPPPPPLVPDVPQTTVQPPPPPGPPPPVALVRPRAKTQHSEDEFSSPGPAPVQPPKQQPARPAHTQPQGSADLVPVGPPSPLPGGATAPLPPPPPPPSQPKQPMQQPSVPSVPVVPKVPVVPVVPDLNGTRPVGREEPPAAVVDEGEPSLSAEELSKAIDRYKGVFGENLFHRMYSITSIDSPLPTLPQDLIMKFAAQIRGKTQEKNVMRITSSDGADWGFIPTDPIREILGPDDRQPIRVIDLMPRLREPLQHYHTLIRQLKRQQASGAIGQR
ncbi:unnamed protein product [Vitrella brassicaformis CCMP3155]|uniref:Next to BRCA1 central domain-containing protein n=1 Tax=Vitrella brassicaformis (strain CCMP3155) TaxID=1169540 RepID=A0A0G4EPJ5_VITBC|nr:unnamed protein product [Vitrella brassicaformis CCMP3155]|eukprot:CEL99753.1 unnamed protein product [Vitrella brassicaformis CCMP3155]